MSNFEYAIAKSWNAQTQQSVHLVRFIPTKGTLNERP